MQKRVPELAPPVQYDLRDGVLLTNTDFGPDGQDTVIQAAVSPEAYEPYDKRKDPDYLQTVGTLLCGSYGAGKVHYAILNPDVESPDATVFGMNWSGYFQHDVAREELVGLARLNPDTRFVVYDNPGLGKSAPLPRSMAKELAATGNYSEFGLFMLEGLKAVLKDFDTVNYHGRSQGGLITMAMAAQQEKQPDSVLVYDAPGSIEQPFLRGLVLGALGREGKHAEQYVAAALDDIAIEKQAQLNKPTTFLATLARSAFHGQLITQYVRMPQSMAVGALEPAVRAAVANTRDRFTFLSPLYSELNDADRVRDIVAGAATLPRRPHTVRLTQFNGTHPFAQGTPDAQAAVERAALTA